MTKIKVTKKKLNRDIRKSRSPRKKLKIVIKIKQSYDKNRGC